MKRTPQKPPTHPIKLKKFPPIRSYILPPSVNDGSPPLRYAENLEDHWTIKLQLPVRTGVGTRYSARRRGRDRSSRQFTRRPQFHTPAAAHSAAFHNDSSPPLRSRKKKQTTKKDGPLAPAATKDWWLASCSGHQDCESGTAKIRRSFPCRQNTCESPTPFLGLLPGGPEG